MAAALAAHFHWPPDFWRRIGWLELRAWLRAMNKQKRGPDPDPGRWDMAAEQSFAELRANPGMGLRASLS